MNKKAKLISLVTSFCLMLTLLVIGVFAVRNAIVPMGGSINFTAKGVNAEVEKVSVEGGTAGANDMAKLVYTTYNGIEEQTDTATWENITLTMNEGENVLTLKIRVTNTSKVSTDKVYVSFSLDETKSNLSDISIDVPQGGVVEKGTPQEYTITFTLSDEALYDGSETFGIDVKLDCEKHVPTAIDGVYNGMRFGVTNNSAYVCMASADDITANFSDGVLVIPNEISLDGVVYPVTQIGDGSGTDFSVNNIKEIVFPDNVTMVAPYAIVCCSDLETITLGKNFKTMGIENFDNCPKMKYAIFTDPEGWCLYDMSEAEVVREVSSAEMSDPVKAWEILKSTLPTFPPIRLTKV